MPADLGPDTDITALEAETGAVEFLDETLGFIDKRFARSETPSEAPQARTPA